MQKYKYLEHFHVNHSTKYSSRCGRAVIKVDIYHSWSFHLSRNEIFCLKLQLSWSIWQPSYTKNWNFQIPHIVFSAIVLLFNMFFN